MLIPLFYERCERITQGSHQKWAMWASRSGRSPKMSNHEQFAHILHQKWTTISESLRSLTKNEQIACFFEGIANLLSFSQKPSDSLKRPMSKFPALQFAHFWCATWVICSHHSLKKRKWANHSFKKKKKHTKNIPKKHFSQIFLSKSLVFCEQNSNLLICSFRSNQMSNCEWFPQIAQDKWATVSKSLRSLISKEGPWANCSWQMRDRDRFAQVAHQKWAIRSTIFGKKI